MIIGYSAAAVRSAERPLLDAGEPLMQRAAAAIDAHVAALFEPRGPLRERHVIVLAGSGANGGDGLHAAALLRGRGVQARALATGASLHEGGAQALREAGGRIDRLDELPERDLDDLLDEMDLVLDAIVGIGGRPEVPAPIASLLDSVRRHRLPVIAVDLPSFLDATSGEAAPEALAARATLTFGAVKAGLLLPGGSALAGTVHPVDLSLDPHLPTSGPGLVVQRLTDADVRTLFPRPGAESTKYRRGVVALAAGSPDYPGAAVLSVSGAARAGAGMVRLLAPGSVRELVLQRRPEVVGHESPTPPSHETGHARPVIDLEAAGRTHALVVGPGLPPGDPRARAGVALLRRGANGPGRGVIDAGALGAIGPEDRFGSEIVLTPHRGEADRLAERLEIDSEQSAPALASALARTTGATVLLKGAVTVVAPGRTGGPLLAQDDATSQLATAGTGDVLAGILGTLLAAGLRGPEAAALAALLHGRAGRLASRDGLVPLVALDVADHLPAALAAILAGALP